MELTEVEGRQRRDIVDHLFDNLIPYNPSDRLVDAEYGLLPCVSDDSQTLVVDR